ncbi:Putative zn(2)-C6 fungal-type DNA-binding domain-containing protein [Septoria linicola]|uniref:Zn(2)-C6 fungal-type DNA-binding domain-containing protein n=1 Tax=Septoria linicola TaxID=215465 RepID=A0A9Q9AMP7_9PEZI|nr:putative zn(2)-C6 fungal-type DNA-binding domain-containing protein [Septoria linicola]USW52297.1 Putative zn(2)-C6 fungal-type DNA-binding domain-containing protein [Septoria linicola]
MSANLAMSFGDGAGSVADSRPRKRSQKQRAASSPGSDSGGSKKTVDVACWPCRKRKAKCTAERPACAPCTRRGVDCSYEYEEGLTRVGSLKMRLSESTAKTESLEYLFEQLRVRSDEESSMLLAVIRLGADLDKVVVQLRSMPQQFFSGIVPDMAQLMMDGGDGSGAMEDGLDSMDPTARGDMPMYFPYDQTMSETEETERNAK